MVGSKATVAEPIDTDSTDTPGVLSSARVTRATQWPQLIPDTSILNCFTAALLGRGKREKYPSTVFYIPWGAMSMPAPLALGYLERE